MPWARCRHRPVGLGRRDGPAAGLGYSSGEATIRTKHSGCCESGVAASMGKSATAMGRGRAVGPMSASTRRPGPTGRSGSWPWALEATIVSSTSGAVDQEWPLRWANRRRRWAAGVPWARCRHRGPREGPAWGTHWHRDSSGETSGSTASGTQLRPQVAAKVSVAVSIRAAVRLLPDLGYPVTPMQSIIRVMLAWACDATDFRPSMNGGGGACASRRTVWASSRERWCDGAGCYRTLGFRPPRSLHAYLRGRATRPIFDHR
jgi:hypothetical protein